MRNEKVKRTLNDAMTVSDLIERLQDFDEDAIVLFSCDYGDYCHTQQALTVDRVEEYTEKDLVDSAYSQSGIALVDANDDEDGYWCEKCEHETKGPRCHKCGGICVDEDGIKPSDEELEEYENEGRDVVILS